jgi:hypothetical protein
MSAFLIAAVVTGAADYPAFAPSGSLAVEVVLYQGDPLGNPGDPSVKVVREWKAVTQSRRPAFFQTGGHHPVAKVVWDDGVPQARLAYEWAGAAIEVLPIWFENGKVYLEVSGQFRVPNVDELLRIDEQQDRRSRIVAPGQPFTIRLAANSPTDQTWVAVRVEPAKP